MAKVRSLPRRLLKAVLWLFGLSIAGYIVLISFFIFGPSIRGYATKTTFDSIQWKASLDKRDHIRQRMVSSLKANHNLIGKTKEQIEQLLENLQRQDILRNTTTFIGLGRNVIF